LVSVGNEKLDNIVNGVDIGPGFFPGIDGIFDRVESDTVGKV